MSWLLFYFLAALHPVAFVWIGLRAKTRALRLLLWALLVLPATWYCWDYFAIKSQHAQMCTDVGGLRVRIQPEKTDRVRLVGRGLAHDAESVLETYYPRAQIVEAMTSERDERGVPLETYATYSALPNPRVGSATDKYPTREPKVIVNRATRETPAHGVFELDKRESEVSHGIKTETRLTKDGKLYAVHTTLVHWWTGIHYPDGLPTWRCPDTNKQRAPDGVSNSARAKSTYPEFAHFQLLNLIFK